MSSREAGNTNFFKYFGWYGKGPSSIKDFRTKSRKIDPLSLVRKMSALAQSPPYPPFLSVRTHHKFRKKNKFFASKSADVRIWRTPPKCRRPLWTALIWAIFVWYPRQSMKALHFLFYSFWMFWSIYGLK